MAVIAADMLDDGTAPTADGSTATGRRRIRFGRGTVLVLTAVYFVVPLYAALRFALETDNGHFSFGTFRAIPHELGFTTAFTLSLRLAAVTTVITLVLMVPTTVYVHLRLPRLRSLLDGITILPIVIPPIVLITGVLQVSPSQLKATPYLLSLEYVVLAMPFAYRALDAGLSAIDLKTLVEASRSLGGNWLSTLWRVVVPNMRTALLSATVLTVALVLGEFTMASLDQYSTLMVWVVNTEQSDAHVSVAVSLLALVITWACLLAISLFDGRRARRATAAKEG